MGILTSLIAAAAPVGLVVDGVCSAADVRAGVVARVGIEHVVAVDTGAPTHRAVRITFASTGGAGDTLSATIALVDDGVVVGERVLGPFRDCDAATAAAVFAATFVIEPLDDDESTAGPVDDGPIDDGPVDDAIEPRPTTTTTTTMTTPLPVPPPRSLVVLRRGSAALPLPPHVGGGVGVGVGAGISPGLQPSLLGRLRLDIGVVPVVIGLGARFDLPATLQLDDTHVLDTVAAAFFLDGCWRIGAPAGVAVDTGAPTHRA
ncbi:MAG TPA: hypothetical protein VGF99_15480, partial [Myxococcota bacterium]